jgi:hypothetical protein
MLTSMPVYLTSVNAVCEPVLTVYDQNESIYYDRGNGPEMRDKTDILHVTFF